MVRCLSLLVVVLLLSTGSPLTYATSNWTQAMEASLRQPAPDAASSSYFVLISALFVALLGMARYVHTRRQRRQQLNRPPSSLLWIPKGK